MTPAIRVMVDVAGKESFAMTETPEARIPGLIEGRIVHYVLSEEDCDVIERGRRNLLVDSLGNNVWYGQTIKPGDHCVAIVVRVRAVDNAANLRILLDGTDEHYRFGIYKGCESDLRGTWHWIERT